MTPDALIVATFVLVLSHVTVRLVAVPGLTLAVKARVWPTFKVLLPGRLLILTPVTGRTTVMVCDAVRLPQCERSVMVAEPVLCAIIRPLALIDIMFELLVDHVISRHDAWPGLKLACKYLESPTFIRLLPGMLPIDIDCTG